LEGIINHDRLARVSQSKALAARREHEAGKWGALEVAAQKHFAALLMEAGCGCSQDDGVVRLAELAAQLPSIAQSSI